MRGFIAKLRRDVRALSPIFAVLILIAIAVIAGIIVYMFTSGYLGTMMGGGSAGQEKVAIETVVVGANGNVTLWCKSTGGGDVLITDAILKSSSGNTLETKNIADVLLPAAGNLTAVLCDFTATNVVAGYTYTVTIVSQAGNQFVSASFKAV